MMATTLARLSVETAVDDPDSVLLRRELARFDDARALTDRIGWSDVPDEPDVEVDVSRWPCLILKALQVQHEKETARLADATSAGFTPAPKDVPALGELVAQVRNAIELSPHRRMLRPLGRHRGEG
jgi:hypothetical protein